MAGATASPPRKSKNVEPISLDDLAGIEELASMIINDGHREAVERLQPQDDEVIVAVLLRINPAIAQEILAGFKPERRQHIIAVAPERTHDQWLKNQEYPAGTIGQLMDPPLGTFQIGTKVSDAIEQIRELVKKAFITYGYVLDKDERLVGVLVMRDMLLADRDARVEDLMVPNPFSLDPNMKVMDAMKAVLNKHYPVYPVCIDGQLIGLVRGQNLFERQAIEISAQAGAMVGVDKEERLRTPWPRSLKFRHPWLQLNLLTAFIAAGVVGIFQSTIEQIVVLAVFLPVMAGQSGNTGCQALAVTLRAMALGEIREGSEKFAVIKELLLGVFNGALVGITAGLGMIAYAYFTASPETAATNPNPIVLGLIVFVAMVGSCVLSGVSGVLVPVTLKKLGADPATASSIFLTTATDVASMGIFLGLAWMFLM